VGRHEVDRVRRHELRRDREVALVLAVLVVDDDDEPPARISSIASSIAGEGLVSGSVSPLTGPS
jgi:hypothetical protein